jgi:hypothetical protein
MNHRILARRAVAGSLSTFSAAAILLFATVASAQEPAPAAPAAPAAGAAAAPAPTAGQPEETPGRFRWGISALGGPYFYNGASGGLGGVDVRIGYQLNGDLAIYGQPSLMIGGGAKAGASGASASALAFYGIAALADYTLADMVYLAAGPEILAGGTGASEVSTTGGKASASSGAFFSVAARAGLALGSKKPERRKAFTIGLDFHCTFVTGGPLIVPAVALGYEAF